MKNDQSQKLMSSSNDLEKCLKIANPFIWFTVIIIIVILSVFCFWGITGNIDSFVLSGAITSGGDTICYVSEDEIGKVSKNMVVEIDDIKGKVSYVPTSPIKVSESKDYYALHLSGLKESDWTYPVEVNIDLPNGVYEAKIITKSEKPISFIIN